MASNVFKQVQQKGRRGIPSGPCVFISHKSEDKPMARAVAKGITEMGADVYFDEEDELLTEAADKGDEKAIVACIEDGLDKCTHLLGLITPNSFKSWWIPYEIGGATGRGRKCAHLVERGLQAVPSFIAISRVLADIWDLERWVGDLVGKSKESVKAIKAMVQPSTTEGLERYLVRSRTNLQYY